MIHSLIVVGVLVSCWFMFGHCFVFVDDWLIGGLPVGWLFLLDKCFVGDCLMYVRLLLVVV